MSEKLSESLLYWRSERPSVWIMDELIRDAYVLEKENDSLIAQLEKSKSDNLILSAALLDTHVSLKGFGMIASGSSVEDEAKETADKVRVSAEACKAEIEANAVEKAAEQCEQQKYTECEFPIPGSGYCMKADLEEWSSNRRKNTTL